MSVCTSPVAESFGDVAHRCQMSRDERWAVLNRNTFQDILNSILTQTPSTPIVFSTHSKVEANSFAKARLRKLCSNGSGSIWSENDNFEDFDRIDSTKIANNEGKFSGQNRVKNNVASSDNQTIETFDSKIDTVERSRSNVSPRHVKLHMSPQMRSNFDPLAISQTNNSMSSGDLENCGKLFPKHDSTIPGSPGRLINDPKPFVSHFRDCESEKSILNNVDLIRNIKPSTNRNSFYNEKSYNSDEATYSTWDKRKSENIVTSEFNIQSKLDLNSFTRDDARKSFAGNEKVFGRHLDRTDLAHTDSIENTECDRYGSLKNNCQSTGKQHSPRASIVYNSPTPTTTESFPFRVPLPFIHPKLKPLGFDPPFYDVMPKFQSPRDSNELDVYRFAINLCTTDSESLNADEKSNFKNSLNRLHEIGMRRELFDGAFERNFNREDFDVFSQYSFGNQFEFFNMSNPLRLFQESMQIKSEIDHRASEGRLSDASSTRLPIDDRATVKSREVGRSDHLNNSLSTLRNEKPTTPFTSFVPDKNCLVVSASDVIKCSKKPQTSQSSVNYDKLDRVQESSFDLSHNNNNNNNRSYCKEKVQTRKTGHLSNGTHITKDKITSDQILSYNVASDGRDKMINIESNKTVSTDSTTSVSNIVPPELVKKSKNHSVLAILGPLLCENTDQSVSPAFSSEDTRALKYSSVNETVKYNDDSSECFRSPNIFKRNLVTGIYGSSRIGKETTSVWLAVSKDVLYNLMDRLLNGERGQMKECGSEEHCGDGPTWSVGFSRSSRGEYPGMSRSGPIETWLRRSNQKKTNSFKSVRYQLHCQRPFNNDPGERSFTVRPVQNEKKHLPKHASEEINVNRCNLKESCLSASSDVPLELTCRTTLPAVRVNSDVTGTPVLRSLLDDDDVFMTSPTRDYQNTNTDTVSPIQCQLKTNKFNFTSSASKTTSEGIDISTRQSSLAESNTGDFIGCSPPSCEENHPGTYAVARKRKLSELLTCTDSDDTTALSKLSEVGGTNKTDEGADDCVRLRSMKWKSSMLLRLREEINSDTTPGQTN